MAEPLEVLALEFPAMREEAVAEPSGLLQARLVVIWAQMVLIVQMFLVYSQLLDLHNMLLPAAARHL